MNQYPRWKYLLILAVLLVGLVYTLPNFYGEAPVVQVQPKYSSAVVDAALEQKIGDTLKAANIRYNTMSLDPHGVTVSFSGVNSQMKAQEALIDKLNSSYVVLLNLESRAPHWLGKIHALPMYLGLDLRGGMHILMQVDMKTALNNSLESTVSDIRSDLRNKAYLTGVTRDDNGITVKFQDPKERAKGETELDKRLSGYAFKHVDQGGEHDLRLTLLPTEKKRIEEGAIQQNLVTLRNRLNGMGLGEPVIQQQGADRIVVQLPGVQDPKRVLAIIGRTATLELHMVDESNSIGSERFKDRNGEEVAVKREVIFTGKRIKDARQGFDQDGQPAVNIKLDSVGARKFDEVTKANINKRMAIILFDKVNGKLQGMVVTSPVIRAEIPDGNVQISGGNMTREEAHDTAVLLRSGALAAPMEIAEQQTVGPSLGKDNIAKGFHSTWIGFSAITLFMIAYYMMFGMVSVLSLCANLLLLVGLLSMMQATLTLPGMAGIALTLGMAIDSNVLINERIREELRSGTTPQAAIHAGYDRAFATILDSNVTTFIAGFALLAFGSGAVKGFAVVLCMGIGTSMFSAVLVSRALVNLIYGRRARLAKVAIG